MAQSRNFAVIGGDMRQVRLANSLMLDGENVKVFGFCDDTPNLCLKSEKTLGDALYKADVIVLPLPALVDKQYINAPFCEEKTDINTLIGKMDKKQILMGGKIDWEARECIEKAGIKCVDYFEREELSVLNAAATAEGGIAIAMNEMPTMLSQSRCFVAGFGRIGKMLCKMLDGIGAKVCVGARKSEAFAWIDAYGYEKCHIKELADTVGQYDVIFNTVPHKIFDESVIKNIRSDTLVIDLASKPGGIDFDAAKKYNIKTIWALSLPGRTSPISAGDIIKQTVINICNEMGV